MASITFVDTVTHIPAEWANDADALIYDVFNGAQNAIEARAAMGFGTMAEQGADNVQIAGGDINGTPIGLAQAAASQFTTVLILNPVFDPHHAATKEYVDNQIAGIIVADVTAINPISGIGTIGDPLTIIATSVASPSMGSQVLLKKPDNSYESAPISSLSGPANVLLFDTGEGTITDAVPRYTSIVGITHPSFLHIANDGSVTIHAGTQTFSGNGILSFQTLSSGGLVVAGSYSSLLATANSIITGNFSCILSGNTNAINGDYNLIFGGINHNVLGQYNTIINGIQHTFAIPLKYATVLNGRALNIRQDGTVTHGIGVTVSDMCRSTALYAGDTVTSNYLQSGDAIASNSHYTFTVADTIVNVRGLVTAWDSANPANSKSWRVEGYATQLSGIVDMHVFVYDIDSTMSAVWTLAVSSSHTGLSGIKGIYLALNKGVFVGDVKSMATLEITETLL